MTSHYLAWGFWKSIRVNCLLLHCCIVISQVQTKHYMESKTGVSIADNILSEANSIEEVPNEQTKKRLLDLINELIQKDFNALLQLLYRIDVDEKKIRLYLNQNKNLDSAELLTDMVIERQLQKIKSRHKFQTKNKMDDTDEKW